MKTTLTFLALILTACAAANAQVAPAATGPGGLPLRGNLQYALRYGETAEFGSTLGTWQTSNISGSAIYANGKERTPFAMEYAGGYTWTLTGPGYATGLFQHLLLSQGIVWHKWDVLVSDNVSYLPQSPVTGFSGIPGIGDTIGTANPAPPSSQSILTVNTHVVDNLAMGQVETKITSKMTLGAGGSDEILRYPDGNGLDTNTETGNATLTRRLDARDAIYGRYNYSNFSFPGFNVSFVTNSGLIGFRRQWSRRLSTDVSIGPLWISSNNVGQVPDSRTFAANANVSYKSEFRLVDASYRHGTNSGAGYLLGATWDSLDGNFTQNFGRSLTIGFTGGYQITAALNLPGATNSSYGGTQATWHLGRRLIVFANYTGFEQSSTSTLPTNVLNQLQQVVGFGIGYSPREAHLRQ